jgi:O-antigen/teichoic acid export membrane protein
MKSLKEKFLVNKTPVLYTGSSVIKAFVGLIVSFIIAKYVSPDDLGIWSSISLALTYSNFLQAGVINGLNLELPYSYGKGDIENAQKMAGVAQSYTLGISIFVFLLGILCILLFPIHNPKLKWGIIAITIVICFSFYQNYLLSTFRSNNSFLKLSYIQIADAVVNFITLFLIVYYLYYGILLKAVIVVFVYDILLDINRPIKVKFYWNKDVFKKISKAIKEKDIHKYLKNQVIQNGFNRLTGE